MYKIVVADDEKIIREGFAKFINNESLGFEVVECFNDGRYVVDYIAKNDVDVIITDIKMTNVSGIDVLKYVYENSKKIKVVLISGFKEFEYAQKAIEYNVEYYLLKPIDFTEVRKVLSTIKNKLIMERENEKVLDHYKEIIPLLKEELFINILMGAYNNSNLIREKMKIFSMNIDPEKLPCALIDFKINNYNCYIEEKWGYGKDGFNNALKNIIANESDSIQIYRMYVRDEQMILLAVSNGLNSAADIEKVTGRKLEEIRKKCKEIFELSVTFEIVCCADNIFNMANNSKIADTGMLWENLSNEYEKNPDNWLIEQCRLLVTKVREGNNEEATGILINIINRFDNLPIDVILERVMNIFELIYEKISENGPELRHVEYSRLDYGKLSKCKTFQEIKFCCITLLEGITSYVTESNIQSPNLIIVKAKKYIDENFHCDLSLQDVADQIFLSPMYFSRFFKEQTGENFMDYLIKVRMNHAMKLLAEDYKIDDISRFAGYRSSRYFGRMFKQYTGYTPKEYYRRVIKAGEYKDGN